MKQFAEFCLQMKDAFFVIAAIPSALLFYLIMKVFGITASPAMVNIQLFLLFLQILGLFLYIYALLVRRSIRK